MVASSPVPLPPQKRNKGGMRAEYLTAAGRAVLRKIHVNEDVVSYIDRRLHQDAGDMDLRVKDPTTYLLRRNLGTHLYLLGMNETEIQYIMGHSIEDPYIIRNHFGNEDLLYEIHQKMKNRPFLNDLYPYMCEVGLGDAYRYLGLSCPQGVYQWQAGRSLPSVDNLYAVSRLWGVSMNEILVERESA